MLPPGKSVNVGFSSVGFSFAATERRGGRERYKSGRPPLPQSSGQAGTCARRPLLQAVRIMRTTLSRTEWPLRLITEVRGAGLRE